jgi:nitric oxide reductase large subunit
MKKLWIIGAVVVVASFSVLGWIGTRIYQEMPPIPDRVITLDGRVVIASGEIGRGQNVWQSLGGMQVGSIWGHGSYVAPDWTADWLHRELLFILTNGPKMSSRTLTTKYLLKTRRDCRAGFKPCIEPIRTIRNGTSLS